MSFWWRSVLGASLFALIALFLHPRSRPLYLVYWNGYGPSETLSQSPFVPENQAALTVPKKVIDGAIWMQVGAQRLLASPGLDRDELTSMAAVAGHFAEVDPDNAFWPQMAAVFHEQLGERAQALRLWVQASHLARWQNYLSERQLQLVGLLSREAGGTMAWQYAAALGLRSPYISRSLEILSKKFLLAVGLETAQDLEFRYATLRNGVLLRDGAETLESGRTGVRMIEYSSLPSFVLRFSPRALQLARFDFIDALRSKGMEVEADQTNDAFRKNEGWLALTSQVDASEVFYELSLGALLAAVLPGAGLPIALAGVLLLGLGRAALKYSAFGTMFSAPYIQIAGLLVATAVYVGTRLPLPALALAMSFSFASLQPERTRSRPPLYYGPFFRFVIILLAIVFSGLVALFFGGLTTPSLVVTQFISSPIEALGGQSVSLGLALFSLSLLLLIAPTWGLVLRIPTPMVFGKALSELGTAVLCLGMVLAVAFAPVALAIDKSDTESLRRIVIDEPDFYLLQ